MNKTAFVTGAEGFIGSHLVKFLQTKGWNVIGGYRLHGSNSFPQLSSLCFVQCDLRNGQRVEQLLKSTSRRMFSTWEPRACPQCLGRTHVDFRVEHHGVAARVRGGASYEASSDSGFSLLERRVRARASVGHTSHRRAATSTSASLRDQQSMLGSAGAESISWITKSPPSICGSSTPPARERQMMRRRISCAS